MGKRRRLVFAFMILLIGISCSLPFQIMGRDEFIATAVQQTMQVKQAQISSPSNLLPPAAAIPLQSTATPIPQTTENTNPCYEARLIGETIPDGAEFKAGDLFTKNWRLRNTGSCTWNPNYRLVFSSGDQMNAADSTKLNGSVAPGEAADFIVDMEAPDETGTHTGYWKIKADNGASFAKIWVQIEVDSPAKKPKATPTSAPDFTVSDLQLGVSQSSDECPVVLTMRVDITANGPGEVELEWDSGDTMGCGLWKEFLTFDAAGTQSVEATCSGLNAGPFEIAFIVHAYDGNYIYYGPEEFEVECTPP